MPWPHERHYFVGQWEARTHLFESLKPLLDRTGSIYDGDMRPVLVVCAAVNEQAFVDDGEANDQNLGVIDDLGDLSDVQPVIIHGTVILPPQKEAGQSRGGADLPRLRSCLSFSRAAPESISSRA